MFEKFSVIRLQEDTRLSSFDCGNKDLNNFLLGDAKDYMKRLLPVTYLIKDGEKIVGYFSLSNDKISVPDSDKSTWRKLRKVFPHSKHRSDYPSVKIGRFGIDLKYQRLNIGSKILDFIKSLFLDNNRTGCSFVTVDALNSALPFYIKNGFLPLNKENKFNSTNNTLTLFYDLSKLL